MTEVKYVTEADFQTEVLKAADPVLVDFTAVWCQPCRMVDPIVKQLAQDWDGKVKVVKLDADAKSKHRDEVWRDGHSDAHAVQRWRDQGAADRLPAQGQAAVKAQPAHSQRRRRRGIACSGTRPDRCPKKRTRSDSACASFFLVWHGPRCDSLAAGVFSKSDRPTREVMSRLMGVTVTMRCLRSTTTSLFSSSPSRMAASL